MTALRARLRTLRRDGRPVLRVQLALLYSGLVLGAIAAVLLATNVLYVHSAARAPAGAAAAPPSGSSSFDLGPAAIGLVAAILALLGAWWLAGRFLRPLREMTATAQLISASNLDRRLALSGPDDELTELGRTLDELFARLEASFRSQRHFVANASHELRTPLAGQLAVLQVALADPDATVDTLRDSCREALELGVHQERLIDALLTLATGERGLHAPRPLHLAVLTEEVVSRRRAEARRRGLDIRMTLAGADMVGDPSLVESLIATLVDNAVTHNVDGGRIEIATATQSGRAILRVANTGPVISASEIPRLFEPFQRVGDERPGVGDGHGLGLTIVRAIATGHGATVDAGPRDRGGLEITVGFPSTEAEVIRV